MTPQRMWHARVLRGLANALDRDAPADLVVEQQMTVVLDARNRPEPDVVVAEGDADVLGRTSFDAGMVRLVIEVVSPESEHRDRHVKPAKYAGAGIAHFWRVEDEDGAPTVHVYERDTTTGSYAPVGVFRDVVRVRHPFPVEVDLRQLIATRGMG